MINMGLQILATQFFRYYFFENKLRKAFQINIVVGLTHWHLLSEESSFFPDSSVASVTLVLLQKPSTEKKTSVKMT